MSNEEQSHLLKFKLQFWLTQARYVGDVGTFVQIAVGPVIDTVELFYRMFRTLHNFTPFEKIQEGGYSLFKEHLEPSEESIPKVVRNICTFECNSESYFNFFLLIVSGKFDNICGIYTQKHAEKNWKIEIWSKGEVNTEHIKSFFGDKIPNLNIKQRKRH